MADSSDARLERYFAGQLSAAEERELAQAALDDPDLFDALTALAVTKEAIVRPAVSQADAVSTPAAVLPFRRTRLAVSLGALATLAASLIVFAVVQRSSSPVEPPESSAPVSSNAPAPAPAPSSKPPALGSAPVILTARLADTQSPEFRTSATDTRSPKSQGVVVEMSDGDAAVDLGSVDGVARGTVLLVTRGEGGPPVGRLTIARVFRERSSGTVDRSDAVRVGDQAQVPIAAQSAAYLERVSARLAAGDLNASRSFAERAVALAKSPDVPPDQIRRAQAALADVFNELGAASIARADYAEAERLLRQAREAAAGAASVRVTNNLAAVAALRGDLRTAETLYQEALALAGTSADRESDRRAIEKNLEAIRAAR